MQVGRPAAITIPDLEVLFFLSFCDSDAYASGTATTAGKATEAVISSLIYAARARIHVHRLGADAFAAPESSNTTFLW